MSRPAWKLLVAIASTALATVGCHRRNLPPTSAVEFEAASQQVDEGGGSFTVGVRLHVASGGALGAPVSVTLVAGPGGTADAADVSGLATQVTFPAGSPDGAVQPATLTATADLLGEGPETLEVDLTSPVATAIGTLAQHTVTLLDDDRVVGVDSSSLGVDRFELSSHRQRQLSGPGLHGAVWVQGLAFDPGTSTLYGADNNAGQLCALDPATGQTTWIGPLGVAWMRSLAYDPTGSVLYGVSAKTDTLYRIDPGTGEASPLPNPLGFGQVEALAFDSINGVLYGADTSGGSLVLIDTTTGVATARPQPLGFAGVKGWRSTPTGQGPSTGSTRPPTSC